MIYNVNDHVATASVLIRNINTVIYDIERGEEILTRMEAYPEDMQIGQEVLAFIRQYSGTCASISNEGSVNNVVVNILDGLRKALVKMWQILQEVFRLLFDSQYRSRKNFIELHRGLLAISGNTEAITEFEKIQCTVISQSNAIEITDKSTNLINLIRFVAECTNNDGIDKLLNTFSVIAGVSSDQTGSLTDSCSVITAQRFASFKEAGWNFAGVEAALTAHINSLSGIEQLKETKTKIELDIKKLDSKITDMMRKNVAAEVVKPLQLLIATKVRITKLIGSAVSILIGRSNAIANILRAIYGEISKIAEEYKRS